MESRSLKKLVEIVSQDKREFIGLRLSKTLLKFLNAIIEEEGIVTDKGEPYSVRYLIDDMIIWILGSEKRLREFIAEMYEVEDDEEE